MSHRLRTVFVVACLMMASGVVAGEELADTLRIARPRFAASPFGRPLLLESSELHGDVRGNVVALVDHPIAALRSALDSPAEWCDRTSRHGGGRHRRWERRRKDCGRWSR